jgi:rubredoxin
VTEGQVTASVVCPKCGKKSAGGAQACPRCGLVFAMWNPDTGTGMVRLDAAGEELWRKVQENWSDSSGHEAFLKHCLQTDSLAAAGRLYRERLDENPKDVMAAQMQNQVLAKASLGLSLNKSEPRTALTRTRWFWVVVLTAMALGIAAGLFWRRLH